MQFGNVGFSLSQRNTAPQPPILASPSRHRSLSYRLPAIPYSGMQPVYFLCRCLRLKFEIFNLKFLTGPAPEARHNFPRPGRPGKKTSAKRYRLFTLSFEGRSLTRANLFNFFSPRPNFVHSNATPLPESPVLELTVRVLHIQPVEFLPVTVIRSLMAHDDKSKHKRKNRTHCAPRFHRATPTLARHSSLC